MNSMKACLNQDTLRSTATNHFIAIAEKAGFGAIELTQDKVEPIIAQKATAKLANQIKMRGLTVASINGPENFNLLTEKQFSVLCERSAELAIAARELNCNLLIPVPSSSDLNLSAKEVRGRTAESLAQLADACGADINLGLEFVGIKSYSVNNLTDALEIVRTVNRRNVGLVLDSFHLYLSGSDVTQIREQDQDRVFLVHVNDSEPGELSMLRDSNRLFPGEGVIDLKLLARSLTKLRYDGFLSLELLRPAYWEEDPEKIATKGRESLRRVFTI